MSRLIFQISRLDPLDGLSLIFGSRTDLQRHGLRRLLDVFGLAAAGLCEQRGPGYISTYLILENPTYPKLNNIVIDA